MLFRIIASTALVIIMGLLYLAFSGDGNERKPLNQQEQSSGSYSGFGK